VSSFPLTDFSSSALPFVQEASKSDLKLLQAFHKFSYENLIGPGLYDIHSPRVPSVEEMKKRLSEFKAALPKQEHLFVNPDARFSPPPPS
jgi:methionine synthase II (cobalamin-independent)